MSTFYKKRPWMEKEDLDLLRMRDVEGKSYLEITEVLHRTQSSCEQRLFYLHRLAEGTPPLKPEADDMSSYGPAIAGHDYRISCLDSFGDPLLAALKATHGMDTIDRTVNVRSSVPRRISKPASTLRSSMGDF